MHLLTAITTALVATAASASPSLLAKRCSPVYDPDLALGYYPPAPCWQTFDPSCTAYLSRDTEMTLDTKHKLAIVFGVNQYCAGQIAEELARQKDGRKNNGWLQKHGVLTYIDGGILVISNMTDDAVKRYGKLTYKGPAPGTAGTN